MYKVFLSSLFIHSALILNAQWQTVDWNIHNTNVGYVGIGTSTPRSQLEVMNAVRVSPSASGSSILLQGDQLSTTDNWSNIRFVAGSGTGSGWLKTAIDNFGGYFSWTVNSATGEKELMRLNASNGHFGIGVTNPQSRLDVRGGYISTRSDDAFAAAFIEAQNGICYFGSLGQSQISIGNSTDFKRINILNNGNVGIGTETPQYKLSVYGTVGSTKVKVTQTGWPDYVFEPDYKLPTLAEVEKYIKANKHLPGIPSAEQIQSNGLDLGENQSGLLKKIEELTLYAIEQNKRVASQQQEITSLKNELESFKKIATDIERLRKELEQIKTSGNR